MLQQVQEVRVVVVMDHPQETDLMVLQTQVVVVVDQMMLLVDQAVQAL
jgi:hypothetical protein